MLGDKKEFIMHANQKILYPCLDKTKEYPFCAVLFNGVRERLLR